MSKREFYYFYYDPDLAMPGVLIITAETEEEAKKRAERYNPNWEFVEIAFALENRKKPPYYLLTNLIEKKEGTDAVMQLHDMIYWNKINFETGHEFKPYHTVIKEFLERYEWAGELLKDKWLNENEPK